MQLKRNQLKHDGKFLKHLLFFSFLAFSLFLFAQNTSKKSVIQFFNLLLQIYNTLYLALSFDTFLFFQHAKGMLKHCFGSVKLYSIRDLKYLQDFNIAG